MTDELNPSGEPKEADVSVSTDSEAIEDLDLAGDDAENVLGGRGISFKVAPGEGQ
jgi:hypothetical protein